MARLSQRTGRLVLRGRLGKAHNASQAVVYCPILRII